MESNNKEKFQKNGNIKDFNSRTIYAILYFLIHDRILYILCIYKIYQVIIMEGLFLISIAY